MTKVVKRKPTTQEDEPAAKRNKVAKADAYEKASEAADSLSRVAAKEKARLINFYVRLLLFVGKGCGSCLVDNEAHLHDPYNCPRIDKNTLKALRRGLRYNLSDGPCYLCHIHSFGQDTLHPEFKENAKRDDCPNGGLMTGFLTRFWESQRLQRHFLNSTGIQWHSLDDFRRWFVQGNSKHRTNAMYLLYWWADKYWLYRPSEEELEEMGRNQEAMEDD